ncbi:hypothetical protein Tco_1325277, partial [Tanacetum coccineum]
MELTWGLTNKLKLIKPQLLKYQLLTQRTKAYIKANDATFDPSLQKNLKIFKREQNEFQMSKEISKSNDKFYAKYWIMGEVTMISTCVVLWPSNTIFLIRDEIAAITTRSGLAYDGPLPPIPPPYVNSDNEKAKETEVTKDKMQPESSQSTANVQPREDHGKGKDKLKDNEKGKNEKEKYDE